VNYKCNNIQSKRQQTFRCSIKKEYYFWNTMKRLLIASGLVLSLAACGSDNNTSNESATEDVQGSFAPIIKGSWIMTDYVAALKSTKSPMAAAGTLKGIVAMDIDPEPYSGDTVIVAANVNNNENATFYMMYRKGHSDRSLITAQIDNSNDGSFYELSYDIDGDDTILFLNHYNANKQLADSRQYIRITGPQSDDGQPYGLTYMANKVLLAGTYNVTDETGKTMEATLTDDGLVTGLGHHTTYFIFTDFTGDIETNLDEMLFDEHTKTQKGYIFEIKGDTTLLYQALENDDRTQLIRGDLKYTMVRK